MDMFLPSFWLSVVSECASSTANGQAVHGNNITDSFMQLWPLNIAMEDFCFYCRGRELNGYII
jgi:hypothetical protein